jgi:hypothetical protein
MPALAEAQWTGLVNVPVGSTSFGPGFGSTASANIDQLQKAAAVAPTKTNWNAGFSQSGLDNQPLFVNGNLIDELTFGSEQIAAGSSTSTDQFLADSDTPASTDGHAIEPQFDSSLVRELQHEAITE